MTTPDIPTPPTETPPGQQQRVDDEPLRLITSFNDIFVVVAAGLLLFGTFWLVIVAAMPAWLNTVIPIAILWGLSEIFVRRRRMALPAVVFAFFFVSTCANLVLDGTDALPVEEWLSWGTIAAACACTAVGAALYWWRFRVPAVIAMGIAGVVITLWLLITHLTDDAIPWLIAGTVIGGIAIFAWALRWDAQDPQRTTLRSDVAFWLHLLAACMITHPIFWILSDHPFAVIGVFLLLAVVSIAVDRRALMLSSLIYLIAALTMGKIGSNAAIVCVVVGGTLLLLSAYWHASRTVILRWMPAGWRAHLPH